jgi:hypothetical protein
MAEEEGRQAKGALGAFDLAHSVGTAIQFHCVAPQAK